MRLIDSLTEFFLAKDHTAATRRFYRQNLTRFFDWTAAQQVTTVDQVTVSLVRRYLDERKTTPSVTTGRPLSSYTLHATARALFAWLRWLVAEGELDPRITARLKLPTREHLVLRVLTDVQVKRLFMAAETSPTARRDTAILSVLLDTGLRAGELCGLEHGDVHLTPDDGYLLVRHGKGRRQREVPLGKRAQLALARYLCSHQADAMFCGKADQPLTPSGLDQVLYALYDRAGRQHFDGLKLGAHMLRHSFAVRYIEADGDVYKLSRLLGHSQITTTEGYLRAFTARTRSPRASARSHHATPPPELAREPVAHRCPPSVRIRRTPAL